MPLSSFPRSLSFTVTNACNCRCWMCGQWSDAGYVRTAAGKSDQLLLGFGDWIRLTDEAADAGLGSILLRGGEPFLMSGIEDLIGHAVGRGLFTAIDTNGTLLARYAELLVKLGNIHLTISMDGPREIHDRVRGMPGCYDLVRKGLERIGEEEIRQGRRISRSLNFTISPLSLEGLGSMPDTARELGIDSVCVMPYYFVSAKLGERYEQEIAALGSPTKTFS